MTSWKEFLDGELKSNKESWDDVVSNTLSDQELNRKFDDGYGGTCGASFIMWTKNYVYFPDSI